MFDYNSYYGMKPMSLKEGVNAPENIRTIRNTKHYVVDACNFMMKSVEQIQWRARKAVEIDDDRQAQLMREFLALVKEAEQKLTEAEFHGII